MTNRNVYFSLVFLLALSVAMNFVTHGVAGSVVSLVIAGIKAFFIMAFFMKLKEATASLKLIALGALVWIVILLGITATDYLTR